MSLHLISEPLDEGVTTEEAKAHLRITSSDQDNKIDAVVAAVVGSLDAGSGGWLGRALRPQTWDLRLDGFPSGEIEIPYPPLSSIVSFKYDDINGTEQTLAAGVGYRILRQNTLGKAVLAPIYNETWPSYRSDHECVRIRFNAGYDTYEQEMPAPIRQAILLLVGELWSLGERNLFTSSEDIPGIRSVSYTVSENAGRILRSAAENLLSTYRVW